MWEKSKFYRIIHTVCRAGVHVAAGVLLLTMLAIVANSFDRYVFGGGIHLIVELAQFVMLFIVFLGLAGTHLVAGHVSVDLLLTHLSERTNDILRRYIVPGLTLVYLCLIFYSGLSTTYHLFKDGVRSTGTIPIPLGPMMAIMPIGCLLMIVVLIAECKVYFSGESPGACSHSAEPSQKSK